MAEGGSGGSHRSGGFAKVLQKRVFRTKEKVLQNLGKADKTTDTVFDDHVHNFNGQCHAATRLQKELKNYINCVKAMQAASKTFYEVLLCMYEDKWVGHSRLETIVENLDLLWNDYVVNLIEQVQDQLVIYNNEFPSCKAKISKRGRKLMDYDSARHALSSLENAKKPDESKIAKATEELRDTKSIYEDINRDLLETLPELYDKRIEVMARLYRNIFSSEAKFQEESAKLKETAVSLSEELEREREHYVTCTTPRAPGTHNGEHHYVQSPASQALPATGISLSFNDNLSDSETPASPSSQKSDRSSPPKASSDSDDAKSKRRSGSLGKSAQKEAAEPANQGKANSRPASVSSNQKRESSPEAAEPTNQDKRNSGAVANGEAATPEEEDNKYEPVEVGRQLRRPLPAALVSDYEPVYVNREEPKPSQSSQPSPSTQPSTQSEEPKMPKETTVSEDVAAKDEAKPKEDAKPEDGAAASNLTPETKRGSVSTESAVYQVPTSNEPVPLPEGVLYQVRATHPYAGDDYDELTFEKGDMINVIKFEDPDEQDDGWLMGILVRNGQKGVFPENFTGSV